ncbi:MAG: FecR family protein [Chitinophagaceae bacterium]|nr:FecR family protein [Chitinophagaceae bacterium]
MDTNRLAYLLRRAIAREGSMDELDELRGLLRQYDDGATAGEIESLLAAYQTATLAKYTPDRKESMITGILESDTTGEQTYTKARILSVWKRWAAAAAVFFLVIAGGYLIWGEKGETATAPDSFRLAENDISPGTSGAILTLDNGQKIVLDHLGQDTIAIQGNTSVISRNGEIVYDGKNGSGNDLKYNTLSTPRGRQFQLVLADGTKVWLNAMSSIRYPAFFTSDERRVEISGEVYFEVAHLTRKMNNGEKRVPFIVQVNALSGDGGEIEVLGTHFNINAYNDESVVKTTLIEGRIKVKKGKDEAVLQPGCQSQVVKDGRIKVTKDVNTDMEIAWKNGFFTFDSSGVTTVMNQIARWYDIDVEYQDGEIPDERFGGDIQRNARLSSVLKVLEKSGVKFRVEGRKVIVMK